ncbi:MAG: hypothetical protein ACI3VY_06800 [Faecousia sp.]
MDIVYHFFSKSQLFFYEKTSRFDAVRHFTQTGTQAARDFAHKSAAAKPNSSAAAL